MFASSPETIASPRDGDDLGPGEETIEDGRCGRNVADQQAPVLEGTVGGHEGRPQLEAAHDDLEQMLPALPGEILEPHVVDDQKVRPQILSEDLVPLVEGLGTHQFPHGIEDGPVQDRSSHAGNLVSQSLDEMGLPDTGRPADEHIPFFVQDVAGCQVEDPCLRDGGIEREVEVLQALDLPKARFLDPAGNGPVLTGSHLVRNQKLQELERRELVGGGLQKTDLQGGEQSGEFEPFEIGAELSLQVSVLLGEGGG